jgi:hypothetical protein
MRSSEMWLPSAKSPEKFHKVFKFEEKGSDVNIAVHMLEDAFDNNYQLTVSGVS